MSTSPEVAAFMRQLKEPIPDALVTYLSKCKEMLIIENRGTTPNPALINELRHAADILKETHGYPTSLIEMIADNCDEIHDLILADFMPPRTTTPTSNRARMEAA